MGNQIVHRNETQEETALRQKVAVVDIASALKELIGNPKLLSSLQQQAEQSIAKIEDITSQHKEAIEAINNAVTEKAALNAAKAEFEQLKVLHESQYGDRNDDLVAAEEKLKISQEQFAKNKESSRNEVSNEWLKIDAANQAIKEAAYKAQEDKKAQDYLHETRSGALDTLHKQRMAELEARDKALTEREHRIDELKKAL